MKEVIPKIVFHYTSHRVFASILERRQLWAHDFRLSNDRRELDYALGVITLALDRVSGEPGYHEFIGRIDSFIKDPFELQKLRDLDGYLVISSFSEESNLLSQWRSYAPENGYSIGLKSARLKQTAEAAGFLFGRVEYDFESAITFFEQRLKTYLKECLAGQGLDEGDEDCLAQFSKFLGSVLPLVKHGSFEEEKEWRVYKYVETRQEIRFYAGARNITPYIPLNFSETDMIDILREVCIGPSDNQHTIRDWTADYLNSLGYETRHRIKGSGVQVYVSGSPYRLNR